MTYREAIQIQIKALMEIYDNASCLRDWADLNEKEAFNNVRRELPTVWQSLQKLDNNMSDGRAAMQLKGDYSINVKE